MPSTLPNRYIKAVKSGIPFGKRIWRKKSASLQTLTDQSEIKLGLLNQYIGLFSLFKQREVLSRNIEESERRLQDTGV